MRAGVEARKAAPMAASGASPSSTYHSVLDAKAVERFRIREELRGAGAPVKVLNRPCFRFMVTVVAAALLLFTLVAHRAIDSKSVEPVPEWALLLLSLATAIGGLYCACQQVGVDPRMVPEDAPLVGRAPKSSDGAPKFLNPLSDELSPDSDQNAPLGKRKGKME